MDRQAIIQAMKNRCNCNLTPATGIIRLFAKTNAQAYKLRVSVYDALWEELTHQAEFSRIEIYNNKAIYTVIEF